MIGYKEVQQLVHNNIVPDVLIHLKQFGVEIQMPSRGTRCPFVSHGSDAKPGDVDIQLLGPLSNALLELIFWGSAFHRLNLARFFQGNEKPLNDIGNLLQIVTLRENGKRHFRTKFTHRIVTA